MISFAFVLAAAALAGGDSVAPTVAQSAPAASSPASTTGVQKTAQDSNEQVCKSVMVTGTRFPAHECHTRAEWAQIAADARKTTNSMTSLGGGMNAAGGNGK